MTAWREVTPAGPARARKVAGAPPQNACSTIRLLLIAAVLIVLSGCSAIKLGYNNADTLLQWRGGKYFNFEGEQKAEFERRVQRFLAWHRRTALPEYARLTNEMGDRLARGLKQEDLVWGYDSFQTQLRQALRTGGAEMGELLDALSPAQIERFQARFEKENREHAREHGLGEPPDERREKRVKRSVERLEDLLGTLTEKQVERIRLYGARAQLDGSLRDLDRKRLQRELIAMVRGKEARKRLEQWIVAWDQQRDPVYADMLGANRREYYRMLLDLDRTLSFEQRSRAVQKLRDFARDFTTLGALDGSAR